MTILVVDDIETNRKLLRATLEAEGHEIVLAADGVEALAQLERKSVDLIVSDILMPNMDGYRFCHAVRNRPEFRAIPFIFATSTYTSPSDEKFALELGADKFLRKPIPAKTLVAALGEVTSTPRTSPDFPAAPLPPFQVLAEYSERLVAKLEEKNVQLEERTRELEASEKRLATQYRATMATAEAASLDEAGVKILQAICESLDWAVGLLWVPDREENGLRCISAWHQPRHELDDGEGLPRQLIIKRGHGLVGDVWERGEPRWVPDLTVHRDFPCAPIALSLGLRGAMAFPIGARNQVLGILEFFTEAIRDPDAQLLQTFAALGLQIGQFIERKQIEEQLRQAQKMDSIGQLAGGVAHDFNNMLMVIQGYSQLLLLRKDLDADTIEAFKEIYLAGQRAGNLTRQLLTFSRKQIQHLTFLSLNEVIEHMIKMLRRMIGEDVTLETRFAPQLPFIRADTGMMEQVLLNLSVNARDAMPRGGRLVIATQKVQLAEESARLHPQARPGDFVCLTVQDTGCGMSAEVMTHVFEPFYTTKEAGKGTGLGLATVFGIVQQHNGWIDVGSEVGLGTTFRLFFPFDPASDPKAGAAADRPVIRGGTETILLVEDELIVRHLARKILERLGYEVFEAGSGVEALRVWEEHKHAVNLLVTDMVMPEGITGRELADRLMTDRPEVKVIYTSGYILQAKSSGPALQEGVNFLQKPYDPDKFAQVVRDCLDRKSA